MLAAEAARAAEESRVMDMCCSALEAEEARHRKTMSDIQEAMDRGELPAFLQDPGASATAEPPDVGATRVSTGRGRPGGGVSGGPTAASPLPLPITPMTGVSRNAGRSLLPVAQSSPQEEVEMEVSCPGWLLVLCLTTSLCRWMRFRRSWMKRGR